MSRGTLLKDIDCWELSEKTLAIILAALEPPHSTIIKLFKDILSASFLFGSFRLSAPASTSVGQLPKQHEHEAT
jgi:hypothetical protein